tara:strand:- start:257691 stop:259316 length:1626 start_codon:yes stop_codon:yes gene_type:complete
MIDNISLANECGTAVMPTIHQRYDVSCGVFPNNSDSYFRKNYAKKIYPDLSEMEYEAAYFYQVFWDSRHDPEQLNASGLIEMLVFLNQLLLMHYESYQKLQKVTHYKEKLAVLKAFLSDNKLEEPETSHLESLYAWIAHEAGEKYELLIDLMCQPSLLRDQLGWANLTRILWVFYHFSLNEMMLIVKNAPFLDTLGQILGRPIDLDAISKVLNMPNGILNVLSVVILVTRFVIDVFMLAKHTYYDEGLDVDFNTTSWQRLRMELDKRGCSITSNMVWAVVNAVTNYSKVFGIPSELGMPIVAGALVIDFGLSLVRWYQEYLLTNKSMHALDTKINELKEKKGALTPKDLLYLKALTKMLDAHIQTWSINKGTYQLNSTAALILMTSFMTSLIVVNPLLILTCYLVCCFSLSLYSSAASDGEYAKYLAASHRLAYAGTQRLSATEFSQLEEEKSKAWATLVSVLFERAFVPLGLLILTAINPALGLTTMMGYLGYKLYVGYDNAVAENKKTPVILNQFSIFKDKFDSSESDMFESNYTCTAF